MKYDIAIIGGGILGLSTGVALRQSFPDARIAVLEKETGVATHQTGRNSGVIHSGIYYKPGSLKAKMARDGARAMVQFCRKHNITHEMCGKLIVATHPNELPLMEVLYERGLANGVTVTKISPQELKEIEPQAAGIAALKVADTGIVSYGQVSETFAGLLRESGADVLLGARLRKIINRNDGVVLETSKDPIEARFLVNCAGLHCDRVAEMAGAEAGIRIIPFKGEYYSLKPGKRDLVRGLIYPVPDPNFPFLGVHLTRMINGEVHAGPNAVLGFKRESYRKLSFNMRDAADIATYGGFWRLAAKYWRMGASEMARSLSKEKFTQSLQRLVPAIQSDDLIVSAPGVRAQAVRSDGGLVDDFLIIPGPNAVHVCNAPSPAATASIEIGQYIAAQVCERLV